MKHQLTERYLDKVDIPADQPQMIVWGRRGAGVRRRDRAARFDVRRELLGQRDQEAAGHRQARCTSPGGQPSVDRHARAPACKGNPRHVAPTREFVGLHPGPESAERVEVVDGVELDYGSNELAPFCAAPSRETETSSSASSASSC